MRTIAALLLAVSALFAPEIGMADELTQMIQQDLVKLGYEPGNVKGELDTNTVVAISKFQAENNLEVTGEPSPQLAGVMKAAIDKNAGESQERTAAELQAAQQACLEEKIAAKKESEKKKRGFSSLLRAASRTAGMAGNYDLYKVSSGVYAANATANDISSAAKDLGLSEDEVEECRNP